VIDLSSPGAVRLDPSGFEALVDAARHGSAGAPPQAKEALADERLDGVMSVMLDPAAVLRLVVAGPDTRLEHRGWIEAEWAVSELGRRAKYYQLTAAGRKQLAVEAGEWDRMATAIGRVMKLA